MLEGAFFQEYLPALILGIIGFIDWFENHCLDQALGVLFCDLG
jgi:uncharacterized membrane protein YhdT